MYLTYTISLFALYLLYTQHCYLLKDILELYYVDTSSKIAKKKAVYKPNPNAWRTKTSANSNDDGDMTTDAMTTHKRRRRTKTAKAMALEEAHGMGLVHRDIKPNNIMLTQLGGVHDVTKVLDFGLVKNVGPSGDVTNTGSEAIIDF